MNFEKIIPSDEELEERRISAWIIGGMLMFAGSVALQVLDWITPRCYDDYFLLFLVPYMLVYVFVNVRGIIMVFMHLIRTWRKT